MLDPVANLTEDGTDPGHSCDSLDFSRSSGKPVNMVAASGSNRDPRRAEWKGFWVLHLCLLVRLVNSSTLAVLDAS